MENDFLLMKFYFNEILGRTIPYADPIGSNIEFYQILQEFDGSDKILVTKSHWIPTVSDPKHGYRESYKQIVDQF
ncbi:unnamed protein product [Adineta ricciae]|uniref:Uncharacterized protein n=1 Tax=Adineta ricciae TaxID=249248 RepID=A0A815RVN0_ADIRI|nr:unnamed protein product [Adineta ricciae]